MAQQTAQTALTKHLELTILTPEKSLFKDTVESLTLPGAEGELGILPGHIALITRLQWGELRVRLSDGKTIHVAVLGGFAEVNHNTVTVLADAAELSDEIDAERAHKARARALERLAQKKAEVDYARAQASLARAEVRLKVLGRTAN